MIKYTIGLDVANKDIKACFGSIDIHQKFKIHGTRTFPNSASALPKFVEWIAKLQKEKDIPLRVCMEATGVYYERYAMHLQQEGFLVFSIVLPNRSKKYFAALGMKSKNDKIDAIGLAKMAAQQDLRIWTPASKFFYSLRKLTRQRQSIQEYKTTLNGKIHAEKASAHPEELVLQQLIQHEEMLKKQLKNIDLQIEEHLKKDPQVYQKVKNIEKIKGVSTVTVSVIIAETFGFELFENAKQLISYAGYDVVENQSGKRSGKTRISKKGNARMRRVLHLPAFNVVRFNNHQFATFFYRILGRHHIKMKAYVAVQKKLLTTIFALWKKNEAFDEYYNLIRNDNNKSSKKQSFDINIETSPGKLQTKVAWRSLFFRFKEKIIVNSLGI